jgi:1-pyrroline-5-carboxylate dehydrogenase
MLKNKTSNLKIGLPWKKEVFLGPLIHENAYKRFKKVLEIAKRDGEIIVEGSMLEGPEFQNGYYVQPTIVSQLSHDHELMKDELFLPLICINEYDSFDKVIQLANESEFGLTAGIFSENENELSKFFDKIEAGLLYANRDSSATTGALVQIQPFVGWKKSGITGKGAGGENYLQQFMRAQTQTRCERINE